MKNLFYFAALLFSVLALGQSADQNYIKTTAYKVPTTSTMPNPSGSQANTQITYFDGLGRPIEKIAYRQSETEKNIVTAITYDGFGRQEKEYLPFKGGTSLNFDASAVSNTMDFYANPTEILTGNPHFESTANPYGMKAFENSPLSRVTRQAAPGDDWAMDNHREIYFDYQTNTFEEVKSYNATASWNPTSSLYDIALVDNGHYSAGQLYKTITKDENWSSGDLHTTQEFKDKEGRVVLKRTFNHDGTYNTYYVYDVYGNLTYVIPPLVNTGSTITHALLDGLCYQYRYDGRHRLVEKKLPGKHWEYIIYDKLDRPVVTGPAYNPFNGSGKGWLFTKYDLFGRVCYTGWYPATITDSSRYLLQNNYNSNPVYNATRKSPATTIDGVSVGYTDTNIPSGLKLLTINYYDSYGFPDFPGFAVSSVLTQPLLTDTKGLATGSWVRAITSDSDIYAQKSFTGYDYKSRPILIHTDNYLGGYTETKTLYDFAGQVLQTKTYHKRLTANNERFVAEEFTYATHGRLRRHFHSINGGTTELLSHNTYDELGNLIVKQVGGTDTSTFNGLQKIDFRYNVRGWLAEINNTNDLTVDSDRDLFAFKLVYNNPFEEGTSMHTDALFNGNISQTYWRSLSDNIQRKYSFDYDGLNRLSGAIYQKPEETVPVTNSYDEYLTYDKNGNIITLDRTGNADATTGQEIDELTYTYTSYTNRLSKVTDLSNSPQGFKDEDPISTIEDYTYDSDGNMTRDNNKGISGIRYNHMNLPISVTFSTGGIISYIYDATGKKLRKHILSQGIDDLTDYLDGFHYKNGVLQFISTAEGYVKYTSDENNVEGGIYNYVYNYLDHLGNIRLSYGLDPSDSTLKILEENHYYPFGLKHTNYNSTVREHKRENEVLKIKPVPSLGDLDYKYKYNGKEWQDELGLNFYDYGFRNYMPDIGRWFNIDPLADMYYDISPYAYVANNPISTIDPDGRYLFGLFGSTASERRLGRAEAFAEKTGGAVVMSESGKPHVNVLNSDNSITAYTKFGDFSSWKNLGQTLKGFDGSMEGHGGNEYTGEQGMREFGEDASTASTYVKGAGVVVVASSVVLGPEMVPAGVGIYNAGSIMDDASTAILVGADVNDAMNGKAGAGTDAAIRVAAGVGGKIVGKEINKTNMNTTVKFMHQTVADKTIDAAKDISLKNNKLKQN